MQASLLFFYGKRHRSRSTPLRQRKRFIIAFELRVSILHRPRAAPVGRGGKSGPRKFVDPLIDCSLKSDFALPTHRYSWAAGRCRGLARPSQNLTYAVSVTRTVADIEAANPYTESDPSSYFYLFF